MCLSWDTCLFSVQPCVLAWVSKKPLLERHASSSQSHVETTILGQTRRTIRCAACLPSQPWASKPAVRAETAGSLTPTPYEDGAAQQPAHRCPLRLVGGLPPRGAPRRVMRVGIRLCSGQERTGLKSMIRRAVSKLRAVPVGAVAERAGAHGRASEGGPIHTNSINQFIQGLRRY